MERLFLGNNLKSLKSCSKTQKPDKVAVEIQIIFKIQRVLKVNKCEWKINLVLF